MHVGHHGCNPTHIEVFAARAFFSCQAFVNITFYGRIPMPHIAHVDGEFFGVFWDFYVFLGEDKRALLAVQCEHSNAISHC